ncbi:STAS domain-containing protein [Frankia sp. AiPs1]|uniref:STAS domain-containing protein n=1 Tax=Frankia sp. AiPs1 TaxID=573493 RepID=UPI002043A753|nr:STAS domain-containing protein [Frankia sp. AiPs1]MCM3922194.1 STAS domain-containing protein [Frankia sp. AiPs1]
MSESAEVDAEPPPTGYRRRTWVAERLAVTVHHGTAETVVEVSGEVDLASAGAFRSALFAAVRADAPTIVVDIGEVDFLDAQGLGALIAARKRAIPSGQRLVVIGARPLAYRLFTLTDLAGPFDVRRRETPQTGSPRLPPRPRPAP